VEVAVREPLPRGGPTSPRLSDAKDGTPLVKLIEKAGSLPSKNLF